MTARRENLSAKRSRLHRCKNPSQREDFGPFFIFFPQLKAIQSNVFKCDVNIEHGEPKVAGQGR